MMNSIISVASVVTIVAVCWIFMLLAIFCTFKFVEWFKDTITYKKSRKNKE